MASFATWAGRAEFFIFMATQCLFLAAFLAEYEHSSYWYFMVVSYIPAVIAWIYLIPSKPLDLRSLFHIWNLYILALVNNIAILFVLVGDAMVKERFLCPNLLKITLNFTPLLLLLLLNTAGDSGESDKRRDLVAKLSFLMAIDIIDAIEIIDIVLEENKHHFGICKRFETAMMTVACLSLLLSPCQIATEHKLREKEPKIRFRIAILRNFVQVIFNLVFLIIRVVIFFGYYRDESIFIAKNCIAIFLSLSKIRRIARFRTSFGTSLLL